MSFDFLYDQFHPLECHVGYRDDFVDLGERGSSYRCQAFLVAIFGVVSFIDRSYHLCRSPSSECPTSWYLFHSYFTF